jgi:hypothetical protein
MAYKKFLVLAFIISGTCVASCFSSGVDVKSVKDLDENMLDLRIYHENLGDALLSKNKDYAAWFVNDMDSILRLMANKFTTHRKLTKPFSYHYKKNMAPYFNDLKDEIKKEQWSRAILTYTVLTSKCNDCHIDHDVAKEVKDVTQ